MAKVSGCSGPEDSLNQGQQLSEPDAGPGRIPGLPGPVGEGEPCVQRFRVLGAEDPVECWHQRGEPVASRGRISRLPGPVRQLKPGPQGVRVLGAEDPRTCARDFFQQVAGGGVVAALTEVVRDPGMPALWSADGRTNMAKTVGTH